MSKNKKLWVQRTITGLCAAVLFCVGGCAKKPAPVVKNLTVVQQSESYLAALTAEGISVHKVGQSVTLVLASDVLFNPQSANFKSSTSQVVRKITQYLNTYRLVSVKVSAYGDNSLPAKQQELLTTEQAQRISQALTDNNLDARLVYSVGYGRKNPITLNQTARQQAENRRIEISFRFYPAYDSSN